MINASNQPVAEGQSGQLDPAIWGPALTLAERKDGQGQSRPAGNSSLLEEWKAHPAFSQGQSFARRLAQEGLTEDEFAAILAESPRLTSPAPWLKFLQDAYAGKEHWEPFPIGEAPPEQNRSFVEAVAPLLAEAKARIASQLQEISRGQTNLPFDPASAADVLIAGLPFQLAQILNRTMILELNVARLEGRLPGDTAEERFASFLKSLCSRDVVWGIFEEYPVLARQLAETTQNWIHHAVECAQRLCRDWTTICTTFRQGSDPGCLAYLKGGAGDSHRGGRTVWIAGFTTGWQLVYKPHSVSMDHHFQGVLDWLNRAGVSPGFRLLRLIAGDDYGWIEFVDNTNSCTSPEEVERFYQRQGSYLAVMYALRGMDFHYENLIASGE